MAISVVLLAYREAENLRVLLPQIKEQVEKCGEEYEILIVDGATSADDTEVVCKEMGARYVNQKYPNFGGAYRTAIEEAKNDKFLIMDADGSHPVTAIPAIHALYKTGNYDVVIGSRYVEGGVTNDYPVSIFLSRVLNIIFRICLGLKGKDLSTDFRMYDTKSLKEIKLESQYFDIVEEILLKLELNKKDKTKLRIGETPIYFDKRISGESKRDMGKFIIGYLKTIVRLTWMRITYVFKK
ncbi:MAG: glycosyltransferase [Agathobacter sp.]|nr:glycosyltransferase [Agathobacter sp.]